MPTSREEDAQGRYYDAIYLCSVFTTIVLVCSLKILNKVTIMEKKKISNEV